ncbi:DNA replication protein psf1 [Rhizoclosmatium sp. JEL0117]|nr:DNA replication protein psf1 [Rhizoclosmatium sp. JEL0117]
MSTTGYAEEALKLIREAKRAQESGMFYGYNDNVVRNVKLELKHLYASIRGLMGQREAVVSQLSQLQSQIDSDTQQEEQEGDYDDESQHTLRNQQTQSQIESLSTVSTGFTVAAQMNHWAMHRNKRLLLVYHRSRIGTLQCSSALRVILLNTLQTHTDAIRDMVWELGGGAAASLAEEGGVKLNSNNMMDVDDEDTNDPDHQANLNAGATGLPASITRAMSPPELDFLSAYRSLLEEYRGTMLDIDLSAPLIPPKDLYVDVRVVKEIGEVVADSGTVLKLMKGEQHYVRRSDVEKFITLGYLVQV